MEYTLSSSSFVLWRYIPAKSRIFSIINALLGAEIVPTAIVPLTSIVTILRFGQETKGVVECFNDQNKQEVSQTLTNLSGRLSVIEKIRAELLDYRQQAESL